MEVRPRSTFDDDVVVVVSEEELEGEGGVEWQ
jgi:hypothetical protein